MKMVLVSFFLEQKASRWRESNNACEAWAAIVHTAEQSTEERNLLVTQVMIQDISMSGAKPHTSVSRVQPPPSHQSEARPGDALGYPDTAKELRWFSCAGPSKRGLKRGYEPR